MLQKYFKRFLINSLVYLFGSFFLGIPFLAYWLIESSPILAFPIGIAFFFAVSYATYKDVLEEREKELKVKEDDAYTKVSNAEQEMKLAEQNEHIWRQTLKERTSGFPTLFEYIAYYEELLDNNLSNYLRTKPHPARTASDVVKEEAKRRREAEFKQRTIQSLIEYYENIAPFLLDFKDQIIDENEDAMREYTAEEQEDPVTNFLTKDEYRKLSSIERNQMALDRFWKRPNKPKWLIGRLYERYVGYLYESQGYDVNYVGVFKGYEDLGRDLICRKGKEIVVIQCKNWSQFKTVFEKHIFQFFGTVFQYRDEYKNKNVKAIFYTTTELSPLASRFAKELGIALKEGFKMPKVYPCIKCNIASDGSKIYHLPFDQQYDNTKIEPEKGEFYCITVKEAEQKGFRRAFRWKGTTSS